MVDITLNKIAAGVVGFAMVAGLALAFTATKANAAELSLSDLVELFIGLGIIDDAKAEDARAAVEDMEEEETTAPAGTGTAGAVACTGTFARNLKVGDTGADVKELQQLLNSRGFTVAVAGAPGSAGMESMYFGPATKSAVTAMQTAYAGEILAPLGLTTGTGFFGASTRAKANALCSAGTPATDDDDDTDTDDGDDDTDTDEDTDLSGEASLNSVEVNSADDDEIEEGDEEAEVAEVTFEFSDGDAMISRIDLSLVSAAASGDETNPWDTFDTIALMVDEEVVAEMDASDEDEYLDEDDGTIRFTGLDILAMEDEEVLVTVVATVANSVDGTSNGNVWSLDVLNVRYVDGDDVTSTDDVEEDAVSFTVNAAGAEDELIVKASASDLDSSIIKVERDSKSDWVTVFVFDLDTDDSESDITIDSIPVSASSSIGLVYDTLVDDARLVIGDTTIDSTSGDVVGGASTTAPAVITFDTDGDVVIEAGERVKAELQLRFKSLAIANEGKTIQGSVTTANATAIDAEGADDVTATGSATGDAHQLMTTGIYAEIVSVDADTKDAGAEVNNLGEFIIKFDVTAFDETYYLSATNTAAYAVTMYKAGVATATPAYSMAISSTASKTNGAYRIDDGETETMTLTITYEPNAAANYTAKLITVDYGNIELDPTNETAHTVSPAEDFETDPIYIQA